MWWFGKNVRCFGIGWMLVWVIVCSGWNFMLYMCSLYFLGRCFIKCWNVLRLLVLSIGMVFYFRIIICLFLRCDFRFVNKFLVVVKNSGLIMCRIRILFGIFMIIGVRWVICVIWCINSSDVSMIFMLMVIIILNNMVSDMYSSMMMMLFFGVWCSKLIILCVLFMFYVIINSRVVMVESGS